MTVTRGFYTMSSGILLVVVLLIVQCCQAANPTMSCPKDLCDGDTATVTVSFDSSIFSTCNIGPTVFNCEFLAPGAPSSTVCSQTYPTCSTGGDCECSRPNTTTYIYEFQIRLNKIAHDGVNFTCSHDCLGLGFIPILPVINSECVNLQISALLLFGILGWQIAVIVVVTIVFFALLIFVLYVYIAHRRGLWPFDGKGKKPKCTWREVLFFLLGVLVPVPLAVYIIIAAFLKFRPFANDNGKWWQVVLVFLALLLGSLFIISIVIDAYGKVWLFVITGNCLRKKEDAVDVPKGLLIFLFVFGIICIVAWITYMIVAVIFKMWPFNPPVKDESTPDHPLRDGVNGEAKPERSDPNVNE